MGKYTKEYLQSKPYDLMTTGERQAATKAGIYPKGYRCSLLCSICGLAPYYNSHSVCRQCYIDLRRDKYMKDVCPTCGKSKSKQVEKCRKCTFALMTGENAVNWRGGKSLDKDGYVSLYVKDHPRNSGNPKRTRVYEHRLAMEAHIGRYLRDGETVHHKNGQRQDNRIENLELWASNHPKGQRVEELVEWCVSFMNDYPEFFDKGKTP